MPLLLRVVYATLLFAVVNNAVLPKMADQSGAVCGRRTRRSPTHHSQPLFSLAIFYGNTLAILFSHCYTQAQTLATKNGLCAVSQL